jgi:hypothetical protein
MSLSLNGEYGERIKFNIRERRVSMREKYNMLSFAETYDKLKRRTDLRWMKWI